jgi:hypothetical protein
LSGSWGILSGFSPQKAAILAVTGGARFQAREGVMDRNAEDAGRDRLGSAIAAEWR